MFKAPSSSIRTFYLFLLFFLMIGIVYSPVIYFNYVFHDETTFWVKVPELGFKHYFHDSCIAQGRYSFALLLDIENSFAHKVSDLKFLKFLAIIILSCSALSTYQQMRRLSFMSFQAFLVISAMLYMPGFMVSIDSGFHSCILTLCILLVCWSVHKVESRQEVIAPILLLLFAITIYPSIAMFYWTLTGMYILFNRDISSVVYKKDVFRLMGIGLLSILIYAIIIFFIHYLILHRIEFNLNNPCEITHDWPSKLQWFFKEPVNNALNLWDIFPKAATSIIVSGFIIFTALITLLKNIIKIEPSKRKKTALTYLGQFSLFVIVFFLTFLPNLAANGNAPFYRCTLPMASLIWLILVWAVFQWMDILPFLLKKWTMTALLSAIVIYAGITTYHNVLYYRVMPSFIEYNAYKSMAEQLRLKKFDGIYIKLPDHTLLERYDEFGVLTSDFIAETYHLIYCVVNETGGPGPYPMPVLYVSYPGENKIFAAEEIYFKKGPTGRLMFKNFNSSDLFREARHSSSPLDYGLTVQLFPQMILTKRQNWYILNLADLFRNFEN